MPPTRIVLTGLPRMLRDVIRTVISRDPGLELVAGIDEPDLAGALASGAEVVVFSEGQITADQAEAMLRRCQVRLVGLAEDGGSGTLFQLRPHRQRLGPLGPERLLAAFRVTADGS